MFEFEPLIENVDEFDGDSHCDYRNTVGGSCYQNSFGYRYCFYHRKILGGLVEPSKHADILSELSNL